MDANSQSGTWSLSRLVATLPAFGGTAPRNKYRKRHQSNPWPRRLTLSASDDESSTKTEHGTASADGGKANYSRSAAATVVLSEIIA